MELVLTVLVYVFAVIGFLGTLLTIFLVRAARRHIRNARMQASSAEAVRSAIRDGTRH